MSLSSSSWLQQQQRHRHRRHHHRHCLNNNSSPNNSTSYNTIFSSLTNNWTRTRISLTTTTTTCNSNTTSSTNRYYLWKCIIIIITMTCSITLILYYDYHQYHILLKQQYPIYHHELYHLRSSSSSSSSSDPAPTPQQEEVTTKEEEGLDSIILQQQQKEEATTLVRNIYNITQEEEEEKENIIIIPPPRDDEVDVEEEDEEDTSTTPINHHHNEEVHNSNNNNITLVHDIYELSKYHYTTDENNNTTTTTTTAICYKTLFGNMIDIGLILQWIAYHHLLGFDHFFFFYRNEVTILPNWNLLVTHPIVTLIPWNDIGTIDSYYDQASGTEVECLTKYASQYTWVYIADIDEYLYLGYKGDHRINTTTNTSHDHIVVSLQNSSNLDERINIEENGYRTTPYLSNDDNNTTVKNQILTIKELLHMYDHMTYLSFGKRQYSLDHRTTIPTEVIIHDENDNRTSEIITGYRIQTLSNVSSTMTTIRLDTNFILSQYPYYMYSYFCHHRGYRRGAVLCPTWRGRSKVIVRPQIHTFINVHGTYNENDIQQDHINNNGTIIHFHPDLYHIKEWPHLYSTHNITIHYPSSSYTSEMNGGRMSDITNNIYIDNYNNFTIINETEISIHNVHTGYLPFYMNNDHVNGIYNEEVFLMKRDVELHDYFQKVIHLATNAYGYPIRLEQKESGA